MEPVWVYLFIATALHGITTTKGLKCRTAETNIQDEDMEWAVRQCVRQIMSNSSDVHQNGKNEDKQDGSGFFNTGQSHNSGMFSTLRDLEHPRRQHRAVDRGRQGDRSGPSTEQGDQRNFRGDSQPDTRVPSWDHQRVPNGRPNRNGNEEPGNGEEGQFGYSQTERRRQRGRDRQPPHTSGQQALYDREIVYQYNKRPIFQPNNNKNNNYNYNNNNYGHSRPAWEESRLASIEPCMIHCIFQELKMLDEYGKLNKQSVMDKMTQRVRDRELRDFLQFTIEECFNDLERDEDLERVPGRHNHDDKSETCKAAKSLTLCLEERGKQACDDWEDPMNGEEKAEDNKNQNNINNNNNNSSNKDRDKNKDSKKGLKVPMRG